MGALGSGVMIRAVIPAFVALLAAGPALAADPVTKFELEKINPEAKKINDRNPLVIHAGPGTPTVGAKHEPPKPGKNSAVQSGGGH